MPKPPKGTPIPEHLEHAVAERLRELEYIDSATATSLPQAKADYEALQAHRRAQQENDRRTIAKSDPVRVAAVLAEIDANEVTRVPVQVKHDPATILAETPAPAKVEKGATKGKWVTEKVYAEIHGMSRQTLANWRHADLKAGRNQAEHGKPAYRRFGRAVRYFVEG